MGKFLFLFLFLFLFSFTAFSQSDYDYLTPLNPYYNDALESEPESGIVVYTYIEDEYDPDSYCITVVTERHRKICYMLDHKIITTFND
jgi:hypothetical protein